MVALFPEVLMAAKKTARKTSTKTSRKSDSAPSDVIAGPPKANPPGISNPAKRALQNIGITKISELTKHREDDLAALHGMGPTGIKALKAALKAQGKTFRS